MIDILGTVHSLTNHHSIALNPSIFAYSQKRVHQEIVVPMKVCVREDAVSVRCASGQKTQTARYAYCQSMYSCTCHLVIVLLNLTCLHRLQHSFFEHLFSLYYCEITTFFIRHLILCILFVWQS